MTLQECYNWYKGTAILVPGGGAGNDGQCLQWWDTVHHEVYGHDYIYTPSAVDLAVKFDQLGLGQFYQLVSDINPNVTVNPGYSVIYGPKVGSVHGHVDTVSRRGRAGDYYGYDSNWGGVKNAQGYPILYEVHHNDVNNNYIIAILKPIGGSGGDTDMATPQDIDLAFKAGFNRPATEAEKNNKDYLNSTTLLLQTIYNNNLEFRTKASNYDDLKKAYDQLVAEGNYAPYNGSPLFTKANGK